jgi:type VI secretion system protein ImpA
MGFDWATAPVSEQEPCGPNLDARDDSEFVDYYFDAVGRLPDRYVVPGMDTGGGQRTEDRVFDPKSIDIPAETARIRALLQRSRDIRLLALQAQFECLAGRPAGVADAVETIADLIALFGDAVHPQINGDIADRRDALAELAQPITMVTALRFMGLNGTPEVTLRRIQVAEGRFTPYSDEVGLSLQGMRDMLASPSQRDRVDAVHAALGRIIEALARIASACRSHDATPFAPSFDPVLKVLEEMRAEIAAARPDLRGNDAAPTRATPAQVAQPNLPSTEGAPAASSAASSAAPLMVAFASHAEARQALVACETYFQTAEPSSAALLLVRQARQLIGQPLVKALEALLPDECGKAIVSFGPQTGFALPAQRLKSLSEDNLPLPVPEAQATVPPPPVNSAVDATAVMRSVEDYFRNREKSSPVPLLLQRARSYMDKDFQALVDELIPRKQ